MNQRSIFLAPQTNIAIKDGLFSKAFFFSKKHVWHLMVSFIGTIEWIEAGLDGVWVKNTKDLLNIFFDKNGARF